VAELIVLAVVIGLVVLSFWPLAVARSRRRSPRDQDDVTDTEPVPPRKPAEPLPGSRPHREAHGKP
jgi:hypothetical protein